MNGPLGTITKWHFHSTSNEVIWPKKNLKFHRRVKKVPFWQFFKMGWDGRALSGRPSKSLTGIEELFLFWAPMYRKTGRQN